MTLEILSEYGTGAAVIVAVVYGIIRISWWAATTNSRLKANEEDNKRHEITEAKIERTLSDIETKIERTRSDIEIKIESTRSDIETKIERTRSDIETKIEGIRSDIEAKFEVVRSDIKKLLERSVHKPTVESQSPVQLNEFGKDVSSSVQAKEWSRAHADKLDLDQDMEEYEIYDKCGEYIWKKFESDAGFEKTVKSTAYQLSTEIEQVLKVYQVELRDEILKSRQSRSAE